MTKKFLIVVICLVTVCAVLGLNDRLNYNGLQYASTIVTADARTISDDLVYIEVIGYIAERYGDSDTGLFVSSVGQNEETEEWFLSIGYVDNGGTGHTKRFTMPDEETALAIESMLDPFEFSLPNPGIFTEVVDGLNWIAHMVGFAFSFLQFAVQIIFDTLSVALSVVKAVFYLLGF